MSGQSLFTLAVHAGERSTETMPTGGPDAGRRYKPVVTPVHHSVGYTYEDTEELDAVFAGTSQNPVYTRYGNPTVNAFEAAVAALEGGAAALAYSSGMAALHGALLATGARAGAAVVAAHDVYGATYALLNRLLANQGVTVRFVDVADLNTVSAALDELKPAVLLAETVSNPLLKVADLPALRAAQPGSRGSVDRGQYVRNPGALSSALPGRGLCRPQRYQVPGRPRRCPGRRRGGRQVRDPRLAQRDQQAARRKPGPPRSLARPSRSQNPSSPRRAPMPQRGNRRPVAEHTFGGCEGQLSGPGLPRAA